ncbi:unnamed protein product [Calicophoron daubneyi]|uniref:Beta-galactosidase n=1 Tax=Calicophoron daubneyi TaxID=300641 RepID=A0AAV2T0I1_CALDB
MMPDENVGTAGHGSAPQKSKFSLGLVATVVLVGAFASAIVLFSAFSTSSRITPQAYTIYEQKNGRNFSINHEDGVFSKDGEEYQIVSGSVHYFRTPPMYWEDRLSKIKAAGIEVIQTDVPWNFHEREDGQFYFEDIADLELFIYTAHRYDLLVIVRIGPYIGSDWSMGGLPPWLLRKYPHIRMRTSDKAFLVAVYKWFDVLLPKLKLHLYESGGPVIMIQIENGYGSFRACDRNYIGALNSMVRKKLGQNIIISTVDVNSRQALKCGSPLASNLATVSFGKFSGDADEKFTKLFEFQPNAPWFNSEYYTGWVDHWGLQRVKSSPEQVMLGLVKLITYSPRISVNIYMFHGGTTFGLWSAASSRPFITQSTSYDFNAPISEAGDTTPLYFMIRDAMARIKNISLPRVPENIPKTAYPEVRVQPVSHLLSETSEGILSRMPLSMEATGQYDGFLIYRIPFHRLADQVVRLKFKDLADYAYVYTANATLDIMAYHGSLSRTDKTLVFHFRTKFVTSDLLILVENAGYTTSYSEFITDPKGITGPVSADGRELTGWTMSSVCLTREPTKPCDTPLSEEMDKRLQDTFSGEIPRKKYWQVGSIHAGYLTVESSTALADTFVRPVDFKRGILIVNSHVVGRYNQLFGPQLCLYVPKEFLHVGRNIFIVIELDGLQDSETASTDQVPEGKVSILTFHKKMLFTEGRVNPNKQV